MGATDVAMRLLLLVHAAFLQNVAASSTTTFPLATFTEVCAATGRATILPPATGTFLVLPIHNLRHGCLQPNNEGTPFL